MQLGLSQKSKVEFYLPSKSLDFHFVAAPLSTTFKERCSLFLRRRDQEQFGMADILVCYKQNRRMVAIFYILS